MREIKCHTTLYFEIPDELTDQEMIEVLEKLSTKHLFELVTGTGDLHFEVNE